MALLLSGTRLEYLPPGGVGGLASFTFAFRVKIPDVTVDTMLLSAYDAATGPTVKRLHVLCKGATSPGCLELLRRDAPIAGADITRRTVGGVVAADTWVSIVVYFGATPPTHIWVNDVEPAYAVDSDARTLGPGLTGAWYIGGDHGGPIGGFAFTDIAAWNGSEIAIDPVIRSQLMAGWSSLFYSDFIDGSLSRPGLIFALTGTERTGLPINRWSGHGPILTGSALTWTDAPFTIYPAPQLLDSEADNPPPVIEPPVEPPPPPPEPPPVVIHPDGKLEVVDRFFPKHRARRPAMGRTVCPRV